MIESYLRPKCQQWLIDPLTKRLLAKQSISPNTVTLFSLVTGLLAAAAIAYDLPVIAISLLLCSGLLDILDGTIARLVDRDTDFGCALDIMCDRAVEAAVIIGLFAFEPELRAWTTVVMLTTVLLCVTSFLVVGIFSQNDTNKSFHYSPGLIERFEAFMFFILMVIYPQAYTGLAILFSILVLLTALLRLREFYRNQR